MPRPLFSIVMTVLNGSTTLEAFLASVAAQTCRDFELIVIDGGSTDATLTIIEQNRHVVTKFKQVPGIGLYAGLNAGINLSEGEWLYFIGCDDLLYGPDTLEQVAQTARTTPTRLIAGSVQYTSGYVMTPRLGSPYLLRYRLHHQGTFYRRVIFDTYRYNEQLTISSDYELNTRLSLARTTHGQIDQLIAVYSDQGVSSVQYKRNFAEVRQVNRRLFTGAAYAWVMTYCWIQHRIWLVRNQLGLLNLKYRIRRRFTQRRM